MRKQFYIAVKGKQLFVIRHEVFLTIKTPAGNELTILVKLNLNRRMFEFAYDREIEEQRAIEKTRQIVKDGRIKHVKLEHIKEILFVNIEKVYSSNK